MILTDYLRSTPDITWTYAKQLGVDHATMRLPDDAAFDPTDRAQWLPIMESFRDYQIKPLVLEPLPNCLHDHIKAGDAKRDESIEKFIGMLPIMDEFDVRTVCFNFMAHIGWCRTTARYPERGGALVTGFDMEDFASGVSNIAFSPSSAAAITAQELWDNYAYFIKAVLPEAEKYGIRMALHPDDPPLSKLGDVSRIFVNYQNIDRAINGIVKSPCLGVTMCQATYRMMGEDLYRVIPALGKKIFFVHFRNASGNKYRFHETFHDNGELDMPRLMKLYHESGIDVPIRVDHVPTMAGESVGVAGYDALGRLYAIGYLRGICETVEKL